LPIETEIPSSSPTPSPTPFGGGGKIFFLGEENSIFTSNSDGSDLIEFDYNRNQIFGISPDKSRMLINDSDKIVLMNTDGTEKHVIQSTPNIYLSWTVLGPTNVVWLSDGKIVFFSFRRTGRIGIF